MIHTLFLQLYIMILFFHLPHLLRKTEQLYVVQSAEKIAYLCGVVLISDEDHLHVILYAIIVIEIVFVKSRDPVEVQDILLLKTQVRMN